MALQMTHSPRGYQGVLLALLLLIAAIWPAVAGDVRVWVNTNSGVYHCPGGRYYGNTKKGTFLAESKAVSRGYRAAYGNACSPEVAEGARQSVVNSLAPSGKGNTTRVWINTSSGVYHCPDSRYYGSTKRGRFATEAEAVASGQRPAYGNRCG